jgi:branched-chain amino acid transport system ATP-binding protein
MAETVLKANNISIVFGGLHAVEDFTIEIKEGELVGLIGPNGAGKTTVFNMLTGVYVPTSGTVELRGQDVTKLSPHARVKIGISRTFQNIRLFKRMSVLENVKVSSNVHMNYGIFSAIFKTKKYWAEEDKATQEALEILEVLGLLEYKDEQAQNLPYGKQRKLEIARALATNPKLLLLDEPAAGMNPNETIELMNTIKFVRDTFDMTILLIEHDMKLVSGICEELTVLNFGRVLAQGETSEVLNDPQVVTAYLGE